VVSENSLLIIGASPCISAYWYCGVDLRKLWANSLRPSSKIRLKLELKGLGLLLFIILTVVLMLTGPFYNVAHELSAMGGGYLLIILWFIGLSQG